MSKECVISIPNNASYSYREALQTAVQIAQLDALKFSTSTENLATVQGLLERYSVKKSCVVLYLDLGHSGMNVGCVKFGEGGWEIISSDTFIEFSGELMDQKLVKEINYNLQNYGSLVLI
jgi:molecular chaperone DnaK (HSP70)